MYCQCVSPYRTNGAYSWDLRDVWCGFSACVSFNSRVTSAIPVFTTTTPEPTQTGCSPDRFPACMLPSPDYTDAPLDLSGVQHNNSARYILRFQTVQLCGWLGSDQSLYGSLRYYQWKILKHCGMCHQYCYIKTVILVRNIEFKINKDVHNHPCPKYLLLTYCVCK